MLFLGRSVQKLFVKMVGTMIIQNQPLKHSHYLSTQKARYWAKLNFAVVPILQDSIGKYFLENSFF